MQLKRLIDRVKTLIAARGGTGGVCEFDDDGKVSGSRIGRAEANGATPLDTNAKIPTNHLPEASESNASAIETATASRAGIFAVAFLGERPTALRYLGIAAVMAGVLSLVWETADRKGHAGRRSDYVFTLVQTSPLFVVLISALFLRELERVTPRVVLGAALTVGGGIMLSAF